MTGSRDGTTKKAQSAQSERPERPPVPRFDPYFPTVQTSGPSQATRHVPFRIYGR